MLAAGLNVATDAVHESGDEITGAAPRRSHVPETGETSIFKIPAPSRTLDGFTDRAVAVLGDRRCG